MKKGESFLSRAAAAVRYTISGITPQTWMSPLQPLEPYLPETPARQWDYPVGRNIFFTPRGGEPVTFATLRYVARSSELLRLAIETRKDQIEALSWHIRPIKEGEKADAEIKLLTDFFAYPDKRNSWSQWLRALLEELLVTDAACIYKRPNRVGGVYALELLDGTTIFPLVDEDGRTPLPPSPAYQQILKSTVKADFTTKELLYAPRNTSVSSVYGMSPVEQVIQSAYTDIERIRSQLSQFTVGSLPDSYMVVPDGMTADNMLAFEERLNSMLSGNTERRKQLIVTPAGTEIRPLKPLPLKDEFDEWLARKICFAFSLPPTAFTKQMNRAQAESEQDRATSEGLAPTMKWLKEILNRVIREDFGITKVEFDWVDDQELDPEIRTQLLDTQVRSGVKTINEVRAINGDKPVEGGDVPMIATGSGYVPISYAQYAEEETQEVPSDSAVATESAQQKVKKKSNASAAISYHSAAARCGARKAA